MAATTHPLWDELWLSEEILEKAELWLAPTILTSLRKPLSSSDEKTELRFATPAHTQTLMFSSQTLCDTSFPAKES